LVLRKAAFAVKVDRLYFQSRFPPDLDRSIFRNHQDDTLAPRRKIFAAVIARTRGASMLEATLVLPIFLSLCFFTIDLVRYCIAIACMNYAAYEASDYLSKQQVELDTSSTACAVSNTDCSRYLDILAQTRDRALRYAYFFTSSSQAGGSIALREFEHFYSGDQAQLAGRNLAQFPSGVRMDIGIIRPGEKIRTFNGTETEHTMRPFGAAGGSTSGWPGGLTTWPRIFSDVPLQVVLEADFHFVTPFLHPIALRATHDAWRRTQAFGVPIAPGAASTPAPAPTATPTIPVQATATIDPLAPTPTATSTALPATPVPPTPVFCSQQCRPSQCAPYLCNPPPPAGCGGCFSGGID
jgi:hypothetical protein